MRIPVRFRNSFLDSLAAAIGPTGRVDFFTLPRPATTEDADTGTLLYSVPLDSTPAEVASGGVIAFRFAGSAVVAEASGEVGYARVKDSAGAVVLDYPKADLTLPGDGTIAAGSPVESLSLVARIPVGG